MEIHNRKDKIKKDSRRQKQTGQRQKPTDKPAEKPTAKDTKSIISTINIRREYRWDMSR